MAGGGGHEGPVACDDDGTPTARGRSHAMTTERGLEGDDRLLRPSELRDDAGRSCPVGPFVPPLLPLNTKPRFCGGGVGAGRCVWAAAVARAGVCTAWAVRCAP